MRINIVLIAELLQYHILSYLSLSELCLLRRVSKYFNEEVIIYFSNLKTLDITGYKNILTEEGFGYMVIHLKQLLEVYLTSCWKCASAINVRVIINRCPNLKVFVADHCGYIDDNILEELGRRCKSINHLDISYCFNVTDKGVSAIAKCCCDLDVLHISSNYGITEKSIKSIAKNCKKLTKLDVAFCMIRSEAFQHYLNKETSLKEIRVTKCPNISEGIIEKLVHQDNSYVSTKNTMIYVSFGERRLFVSNINYLQRTMSTMENKVANMRIDYGVNSSFQSTLPSKDPYKWFKLWFQEAVEHPGVGEPNAMSLSTASSDGTPSCRYVLLKGYSDKGFRFFTNYLSQKGQDLTENPKAALTFYWEPLRMQIRINGDVERLSNEESTEYFHSRPFSSQISALVSKQTMVLPKNRCLKDKTCELTEQYKGKIVPKPHYWGGYLVKPHSFEFWCGGSARLHDRIRFRKQGKGEVIDEQLVSMGENGWLYERLSP